MTDRVSNRLHPPLYSRSTQTVSASNPLSKVTGNNEVNRRKESGSSGSEATPHGRSSLRDVSLPWAIVIIFSSHPSLLYRSCASSTTTPLSRPLSRRGTRPNSMRSSRTTPPAAASDSVRVPSLLSYSLSCTFSSMLL